LNISLDGYRTLELEDIDVIKRHYREYPPMHSDYVFSTMFSWSDYMTYGYQIVDGNLLIMTECGGQKYLRPPHGRPDPDLLDEITDLARSLGTRELMTMADIRMKEWISLAREDMHFTPQRDYFDYVYLSGDLADLGGKKYIKIRNYLNRFHRSYEYTVEDISRDDFREVKDFLERWCEQKGCGDDPLLEFEKKAVNRALNHIFDLDLSGLAIRIDGEIQAFSLYEMLYDDTALVHFEKGDQDFIGIYQAINNETAKRLSGEVNYINRESDMGVEGLRRAKMKYRPHHMLEVFNVLES
jgi:hypothetical protein